MFEVSRDAVLAGNNLASCSAEQSKYCSICTVTLGSCGDLSFTSLGRWKCLRGGAGAVFFYQLLCRLQLRYRIPMWALSTVTLGPCGDLPFTSWGRWQCHRGGVDEGLNSSYAACGCGTEYRFGDMLEAVARIPLSKPNEAMARIAPRSPMAPLANKNYKLGSLN
jgi:hypothetical protein